MLKLRYVTPLLFALAASQVFAQQATSNSADTQAQKQNLDIDTMKGCYAANQFYSGGMHLEVKAGTMVCAHSKSMYGNRDASLPFEWVKESEL